GSGQKPDLLQREFAFAVVDLARQLTLLEHPGISNVNEWRQRDDLAHDWNAIFKIHDTLRIAANIDNVVIRPRYAISRFRIGDANVAHHVSDRRDLPEIETADIEVAAHKESLIIRHCRAAVPLNERGQESNRERVPPLVHRMEISKVRGWPVVIHRTAKKAAGVFEC